jgi:hypothetical protein
MKVSKWNTVRLAFTVDVEIKTPADTTLYLSFWVSDEQAPWGNTTTLSVQSRTGSGSGTVYVPLHGDPVVASEFRRFVGNTNSTPADGQRIIGLILRDAAPRGELSQSQQEAWDGFVEAIQFGYAVEIGGAA